MLRRTGSTSASRTCWSGTVRTSGCSGIRSAMRSYYDSRQTLTSVELCARRAMTRTVLFHELGGPEVLRLEDAEVAEPGPGEVRIRVEAIGLNRAELLFRGGHYIEAV